MLQDKAHFELHVPELEKFKKIDAIKALRAMSGMGLKESKDIIDRSMDITVDLELRSISDEAISTGVRALMGAGVACIVEGRYEEYKEQLKELICVATMKEDYYFAARLADFMNNF